MIVTMMLVGVGSHHINHHFPETLPFFSTQINENITVLVLEELEGDSQMVVFQHRLVIVHQSQFRTWTWTLDGEHENYRNNICNKETYSC